MLCYFGVINMFDLLSQLIFLGPPSLDPGNFERFQIHRAGSNLRLACPVQGDPSPWVEWSKDDIVINSAWSRFRTLAKGSLKARDLMVEDSGSYVCKATNGFGSISAQIHLFIRRKCSELWFVKFVLKSVL